MKRSIIVLLSAALLAMAAFGCGNTVPGGNQMTDPPDFDPGTTTAATTTEDLTEDPYFDPYEDPYDDIDYPPGDTGATAATMAPTQPGPGGTAATTTRAGTTTTRVAGAATTTTRPGAQTNRTTTTTRPPTATTTNNQQFANPINIANTREAALERFNSTIAGVINRRAGFNKYHLVAGANIDFNTDLLNAIPAFPPFGSPAEMFSQAVLSAMTGGAPTATQQQGLSSNVISSSTLTSGDVRNHSVRREGSDWIITLYLNNSNSRFRGGQLTGGNPPIQRGPLARASDAAGITVYDHMTADRAFAFLRDTTTSVPFLTPGSQLIVPTEVTESTSNVRYIMRLDGGGHLLHLQCIYDQTITMVEGSVFGQTMTNMRLSQRVTVNFRNFTR